MNKIKIGINGFGRIGRQVLKTINSNFKDSLEVVAINDLGDIRTSAHLLKYDSTHGRFQEKFEINDNGINISGRYIKFFREKSPENINWDKEGVQIVIESTGIFTDGNLASSHLGGSVADEQQSLLEMLDTKKRLQREYDMLDQTRRQLAARTALKETLSNADPNN